MCWNTASSVMRTKPEGGDQVVDAVVDLRVHVVGPPGHHQNFPAGLPGKGDVFLTLLLHQPAEIFVGGVGLADGLDRGPLGNPKLGLQQLGALLLKIFGPVQAQVGMEVFVSSRAGMFTPSRSG